MPSNDRDPPAPSDRSSGADPGEIPTVTTPPQTVKPGLLVGPYHLLHRIGEGGMGEVWLAEQARPVQRQVAFKVIKPGMDSAQVIARFEAERQALALMDHPAIATVFDGGTTPEGRLYFAMEYVRGEPITTYCDRHALTVHDRLKLFLQVCQGVQHAHQKGIIHRDLKPSNVLVTVVDDGPVPKIIDFGVAKATARRLTDRTLFTELGAMIGTPEYMSPEQAEMGGLDIDTRADVYALGVLLYELLTGVLPFDRGTLRQKGLDEIRRTIRDVDPPKPSTRVVQLGAVGAGQAKDRQADVTRLAGQLRGDLDWITMRALEKDRTRRYETVAGLAADVQRHLQHEPVAAGPPSTVYRARKFVRRHRFGVGAAVSLVVLLIAFGITMAVQAGHIARERDRANREATASRQVSEFLVGLFQVSDPSESRGSTVTAREILDKGAERIETTLHDQPEVQSRLLATMGNVYTSLGVYRAAVPLLERAVATRRQILGDDHVDTMSALNQLANSYWYLGQLDRAEPLYGEVVNRRRRVLGPEHPDTLRAESDLASSYVMAGQFANAEPLTAAILEKQLRVLGPDHADTLDTMNNLGSIYFRLGRFADAEPIAKRVLDASTRKLGLDHPSTLLAMHNVATILDKLGKAEEAEALFLEVIRLKHRVLGDAHPQTARTRAALASMYRRLNQYDKAEPVFLEACAAYQRTLGAEHTTTQACLSDLVGLYDAWNKPAKAAEWRKRLTKAPATIR